MDGFYILFSGEGAKKCFTPLDDYGNILFSSMLYEGAQKRERDFCVQRDVPCQIISVGDSTDEQHALDVLHSKMFNTVKKVIEVAQKQNVQQTVCSLNNLRRDVSKLIREKNSVARKNFRSYFFTKSKDENLQSCNDEDSFYSLCQNVPERWSGREFYLYKKALDKLID